MKRNKRLLAILIVAGLVFGLAGCRTNRYGEQPDVEDPDYEEEEFYQEEEESYQEEESFFETDAEYQAVPDEVLGMSFQLEDAALSSFRSTVSGINVEYQKSEQYGLDAALTAYEALEHYPVAVSNQVIKDKKVDYNRLLTIVKQNNSKTDVDSYYTALPDSVVEKTVKYITEAINYNLTVNPKIDLNVLDYKLKNLKVRGYSDLGYAFYSQDDLTMALNMDAIPNTSNDKITAFEEIVAHEANHIVQDVAIRRDAALQMNMGVCYQFEELEINPLYWEWFVEAAAQSMALLEKDLEISDSVVYTSNVSALYSIMSTYALVNENVYELPHITAQSDLNAFFSVFGCETEKEKREVLELMVAYSLFLESADTRISGPFFEKTNLNDYAFDKHLQCSIGQSLAKLFYKNLANKLSGETVRLKDVFSLISVFETRLSKESWYASEENIQYLDDFYKNYGLIQDAFFEMISKSLAISIEDLNAHYINYHHTTDHGNFDNALLSEAQNSLYKKIYADSRDNQAQTVSEINRG